MDASYIFRKAKNIFLRQGKHEPLLFVESESRTYILPIGVQGIWNGTSEQKEALLFTLGARFAQDYYETVETIQKLFLVSETWFVEKALETSALAACQPSQHPERREGIMVLELRFEDSHLKQEAHMAEIILSGDGSSLDLAPLPQTDEAQVRSWLLPSFLAGVASVTIGEEEFDHFLHQLQEKI